MKYRKKPVIIEAVRFVYSPKGIKELKEFCGEALGNVVKARHPTAKGEAQIKTLEDGAVLKVAHIATEGDWIIKGDQGEFYAIRNEIFLETYEELQDE